MITFRNISKHMFNDVENMFSTVIFTFDVNGFELNPANLSFENYENLAAFSKRQVYNPHKTPNVDYTIKAFTKIAKETFINQIDQDQEVSKIFQFRWLYTAKELTKFSEFSTQIWLDSSGFSLGLHLDNQYVVGNLILNLIDNETSTKFYTMKNNIPEIFLEAPKEKNKGVFFLNTPGAIHNVQNSTSRNRYVLNSYWNLNLQKETNGH